ncbi:MAG TPA: hypothetical protein VKB86_20025, partial [Pyrinomonadaceae bacterium]|nr:hypothetical protein [Pyrinomonadaceae bacterium]
MRRFNKLLTILLLLSICFSFMPVARAGAQTSQTKQEPAVQDEKSFKFTKTDLDLLEQMNLLDKQFEKEGLVYH